MTEQKRTYVETEHGGKAHVVDPEKTEKITGNRRTMCGMAIGRKEKVVGISERKLCNTCSLVLRRRAFPKKAKPKLPAPTFQERWDSVQRKVQEVALDAANLSRKKGLAKMLRMLYHEQNTLRDEAIEKAKADMPAPPPPADPFANLHRYEIRVGRLVFDTHLDPSKGRVVMNSDDLQMVTDEIGRLMRENQHRFEPSPTTGVSVLEGDGFALEVTESVDTATMTATAYMSLQRYWKRLHDEVRRLRRITDKLLGE